VDVSNPLKPRVRISHIVVIPRAVDFSYADTALGADRGTQSLYTLLQRLVEALPALSTILDWDTVTLLESSWQAARVNGAPREGTKSFSARAIDPTAWVRFDDETPVQPAEKVFRIDSNIYLSSEYGAIAPEVFNVLKIGAVVNLVPGGHTNVPDAFKGRPVGTVDMEHVFSGSPVVEYLSMQVHDQPGQDLKGPLVSILPTVETWLAQGRRILIHCSAGLSRSVSVILAILMKRNKLTLADAVSKVAAARGRKLQCNMGFWMQLVLMERELHGLQSPSLDVLPWIVEDAKGFFSGGSSEVPEGTEGLIVSAFVKANYDFNRFMDLLLS